MPEVAEARERGSVIARKLLPIISLRIDAGLQVRVAIDQERVDAYAAIIQEHGAMDAMTAFVDAPDFVADRDTVVADSLLLAEGFHRRLAYLQAGVTQVPVDIRYGTRSDALAYAARKNCRHGAVMTNADKRRAAELYVMDPELGALPDKQIAKNLGVSESFVNGIRRGVTPASKSKKKADASADQAPPETSSESGPRETEAVPAETAASRPTRKKILAEIESHVKNAVVDEQDIVGLFENALARYVFMPKKDGDTKLVVYGPNGRKAFEVRVLVKSIAFDEIALKSDTVKLKVAE